MTGWLLIGFAIGGFLGAVHSAILYGVDGATLGAVMLSGVLLYMGGSRLLGRE